MNKNFFTVICIVFLFGCTKDKSPQPEPEPPTAPEVSFVNHTKGSSWTYRIKDLGEYVLDSTYTVTATGRDTSINNRKYYVYENSGGENSYLSTFGPDYYEYSTLRGFSNLAERLIIKPGLEVWNSWTDVVYLKVPNTSIPLKFTFTNELREKGSSISVKGVIFPVAFHIVTMGKVEGSDIVSIVIDHFYSPNYGLVYMMTDIWLKYEGQTIRISETKSLISSDLK